MQVDEKIENKLIAKEYKNLLRSSYRSLSEKDKKLIRIAFDTSVDAHKNQRRKSGEAYVFHPIGVAKIVASQIGLDATSISAALLHDVIEDTKYRLEDIEKVFGNKVSRIVEGLTKISNLKKDTEISFQAENFRKMLLTLNDDIRVIIIKIADRLHNMQTLEFMTEKKQLKIASETLYIYAPIAHRIGMYNIKNELEDLSLRYTDNKSYSNIKSKIEESKEEQEVYIKKFSRLIKKAIDKEKLKYFIQGRNKSIYSIHQKMQKQKISYENVFDKFAIRIVYKSSKKKEKFLAWKIYSIITDYFIPNPTRLRDWISSSKSNGYESLHITVLGPNNKWIEIQIRSERMHEIAEKGYAAHYKYKQGEKKESSIENWLNRLKEVLENKDSNAVDFVEDFKLNLYSDEIFVFTPKGELKSLPSGSCALDFAFNIHTEIGINTRGARVNGKLVPLSKTLKSGDQIEIITSKNSKPSANWLDFVITSRARTKIKNSLNEEKKEIATEGEMILKRKLNHLKVSLNKKNISELLKFFKLKTPSDLYYRVGFGSIDNKKIKEFLNSRNNKFIKYIKDKIRGKQNDFIDDSKSFSSNFDKIVFGTEKEELPYSLSKCCNPISGDKVFGFISVKDKIKVHKNSCKNAIGLQSNFAYRIISAYWIDSSEQEFGAIVKLSGIDTLGLVNQITKVISKNMSVNIKKINFNTSKGLFIGEINVFVKNNSTLERLLKNLSKINGIEKVTRE
ncbi:MAG: RelA/SpoT family protein [Flavobacteriaceae bacterium]|tara:strand:+ start:573 stop:2774 length:2202 start_codon:yes stop_codon:yes gene_type:complete